MAYPIVTRDKTRREMEINGKLCTVAETVFSDYGSQGVTKVYILATSGTEADDAANRANLDRVLSHMGYRLKK